MSNSAAREPWFLEGRRSVLQRAILTSVVLGGLGFLAGLVWLAETIVLSSIEELEGAAFVFAFGVTGSLALSLTVAAPYQLWNGKSSGRTIACVIFFVNVAAILSVATAGFSTLAKNSTPDVVSHSDDATFWLRIAVTYLPQFVSIWLAWCAALYRRSWGWLIMCGLSACSLVALPVSIYAYEVVMNQSKEQFPLQFREIFARTFWATLTSQFFALLMIPWGIPFWFPPDRQCSCIEETCQPV